MLSRPVYSTLSTNEWKYCWTTNTKIRAGKRDVFRKKGRVGDGEIGRCVRGDFTANGSPLERRRVEKSLERKSDERLSIGVNAVWYTCKKKRVRCSSLEYEFWSVLQSGKNPMSASRHALKLSMCAVLYEMVWFEVEAS